MNIWTWTCIAFIYFMFFVYKLLTFEKQVKFDKTRILNFLYSCVISLPSYDIACDWDGVINSYVTGYGKHFDKPVPGAIEWLIECYKSNIKIIIYSTRFCFDDNQNAVKSRMIDYLIENGCPKEVVNNLDFWVDVGKPKAKLYIDDRAFRFEGVFPSPEMICKYDVWNRKDKFSK